MLMCSRGSLALLRVPDFAIPRLIRYPTVTAVMRIQARHAPKASEEAAGVRDAGYHQDRADELACQVERLRLDGVGGTVPTPQRAVTEGCGYCCWGYGP